MISSDGESWYYEVNGERNGPAPTNEVAALVAKGTLSAKSLVWRSGFPDWVAIHDTSFGKLITTPPPVAGRAIDNAVVWWLAFAPIIGSFVGIWLASSMQTSVNNFWWITLGLNIGLGYFDESRLKRAGYDTAKMGMAWLVPVYLFKRAKLLDQSPAYFVVWLVAFFVSLFL